MIIRKYRLLALLLLSAMAAHAQSEKGTPHIGYLYPAGGQQGSVFNVYVGGQNLRTIREVYFSGEGLSAEVIRHYRPVKKLDAEQRKELQRRLKDAWIKRWKQVYGADAEPKFPGLQGVNAKILQNSNGATTGKVELPAHPLLDHLDDMSLRQLAGVMNEVMNLKKKQVNMQIAEILEIEVTIDFDAEPGDREVRLESGMGLSNPMCFQIGLFPEYNEIEPNDPNGNTVLPDEPPIPIPVLLNGQVKPGDIDRFGIQAQKGQKLVMEVRARHLIPYLADAVPGWFQATLALYDPTGQEVAYNDDYRFNPDPVLYYEVPEDGIYSLEIRDSIYRGREDFVYRIAVGELPFITSLFPMGGEEGSETLVEVDGWNLPENQLGLDTQPGNNPIRQVRITGETSLSNCAPYHVDNLPEYPDVEPNDSESNPQTITIPTIINGHIDSAQDKDVFCIHGKAGTDIVADIYARRLNSPLDALLRITDATGKVLAWNDDVKELQIGLLTHQADSYLQFCLPADGTYYVQLSDSQQQGGPEWGYRLRLSTPRPDFDLYVAPSTLNVQAGGAVPICVYVLRKDGFNEDIVITLKDPPQGFSLQGALCPAGKDRIRMTLSAPAVPMDYPIVLRMEGHSQVADQPLTRPVIPADDLMQAFLYRHLVPAQALMVVVPKVRRPLPEIEMIADTPLKIPLGGSASIMLKIPEGTPLTNAQMEMNDPPKGISLSDVKTQPDGWELVFQTDPKVLQAGFYDNVIVNAFILPTDQSAEEKPGKKTQRISLGVLPAIPVQVIP